MRYVPAVLCLAARQSESAVLVQLLLVHLPEVRGIVGDAFAVVVVLDGGAHGLLGQHAAVDLVRGQPVQRLDDRLVRERERLVDGLALDHLGGHGACGNGRAAAEGVELDVGDGAVFIHLDIHAHDVAALGIADLADAVGVVDLADVAGIAEMIHNFFTVKCHDLLSPFPYLEGDNPSGPAGRLPVSGEGK